MWKIIISISLIFFTGCESTQKSNGFARDESAKGMSWHIGSQSSVELVTKLEKVWTNKDFENIRIFFDDTATFEFAEGHKIKSFEAFSMFSSMYLTKLFVCRSFGASPKYSNTTVPRLRSKLCFGQYIPTFVAAKIHLRFIR